MPAVVVVTEQFEQLARVVMKSRDVQGSAAVLIKGRNPELLSEDELAQVADDVLREVVMRLTGTEDRSES